MKDWAKMLSLFPCTYFKCLGK